MGRNADPAARQCTLRVLVSHNPQRQTVLRVGLSPAPPAVSRRLHRLQTRAVAALSLPGGWRRHPPHRRREGKLLSWIN